MFTCVLCIYLTQVICHYGGQVDDSYSNRITHVLCEHQKSDVFQLVIYGSFVFEGKLYNYSWLIVYQNHRLK